MSRFTSWTFAEGLKNITKERGYSHTAVLLITRSTVQGLTFSLLSGRNKLLSLWYSDSTLNAFFKYLRQEEVLKRETNLWYCMTRKEENKNLEEYEIENYYLRRWSDKRHLPYNWLGLSDEDNSVSPYGPITLWMWMSSTVLYLLMYSLTVAFCTIS